jgi:Flp pilus assembly protein TadB
MIDAALFAIAGLAAAAAFRAAVADHRLNGRPSARRGPLLACVGRPLAGVWPRLFASPPWPYGGGEDLPPLRAGAIAVFGTTGCAVVLLIGGALGWLSGLTLAGFGVAYADLAARGERRRFRDAVERDAPALLDLLAAAVACGVPIDAALRGCRSAAEGALAGELDIAFANLDLGSRRRDELQALAERTGSPTLAGLALAVSLADRLGAPLADQLRAQARRARADRARVVQERAAAAGPRLLLVVVFVLVPAALLPLGAAVALSVAGSVSGF